MSCARDVAVSAALSALLTVILPLQTYLGNAAIYPFSLWRLLPELFTLFVVFSAMLTLASRLFASIRFMPSAFLPSVLAALAICVYLESGMMSIGIPELNGGSVPELSNALRGVLDATVWMVVVAVFVVCSRRLKPYLHWVALSVLLLSLASLLDVRHSAAASQAEAPAEDSDLSSGFASQPTVLANVKYSSERNILVFVLDSMAGTDATFVMRMDPVLREKFHGFSEYPRNIGMHECTKRGIPGLVTGRHYDPDVMSQDEYPMSMYGKESFVTAAVNAGWNVSFSPDLLPYGFTNLPKEKIVARMEEPRARDRLSFLRQSTEVPFLSLFDMVAFRLSPFVFKSRVLYSRIRHSVKGRRSKEGFWGERDMYPALAARPISKERCQFLGLFHSWGVHPPWSEDRMTVVHRKLALLGELMDAYRASGIYDKSLIVVTSDHGNGFAEPVDGYPATASACLWVKPEGAVGTFQTRTDKTSHANIARMIKAAISRRLSADEIAAILLSDNRLFRAEMHNGTRRYFEDWSEP